MKAQRGHFWRSDERGISDIVGTITLLAITVTIVGVAIVGFYSANQNSNATPPAVDLKASAAPGATAVTLTHAGGSVLDRSTLTYKVTSGGTLLGSGTVPGTGPWDIGQAISLPLQTALATTGSQPVEIDVISQSVGAVVASTTLSVTSSAPVGGSPSNGPERTATQMG